MGYAVSNGDSVNRLYDAVYKTDSSSSVPQGWTYETSIDGWSPRQQSTSQTSFITLKVQLRDLLVTKTATFRFAYRHDMATISIMLDNEDVAGVIETLTTLKTQNPTDAATLQEFIDIANTYL